MKKIGRSIAASVAVATLVLAAPAAHAVDITDGWSTQTTISIVYSTSSATMFQLTGTTRNCGHADFWVLALNDSASSKTKHALLIAAFTAGKQVLLRCENHTVTDFQVFN